ncbi:hypothetical protein RN001_008483 [Aquatica leii]|uniref:WD repeat-containing protein 55 homolog n=1 Tax=Aquatica leii TaxID=1421715 RepID=A0AAN7SGT4_9COLE|nr:hypothetical protein RN001_008483 [Aquatica leii]
MGSSKRSLDNEENLDSSDSDVSITDSEADSNEPNTEEDSNDEEVEEEEEDEVLKAIRRENEKKRNHPPPIICDSFITDISFHPLENILAVANIEGDCILYQYSNEENCVLNTLELHKEACRDIEFSHDGKILFSVAKDKSIMLSDVESGKLIRFYDDSHEVPAYCITVLDDNLFCTGDDDGTVKLWDLRIKNTDKSIFSLKKNADYISDIITNESLQYLICSSGDGSLTTIDLQKRQFFVQSEEHDEELTCLGLFRSETKILSGTSNGKLVFYNWNEFGLYSDIYPTSKTAINSLVPITENIVVTAYEDGHLRATNLFPHKPLGVVGQHNLSAENLDICNNGKFIASTGHDHDIRFWNIEYFEEFEQVTKKYKTKNKRKEEFNLPSSKRTNVADFFNDLT